MAKVIFTPWKNHSQLLSVRSQFYPDPTYSGPDLRSNACATVGSWKFRGNLPHPIEATALLTDAILHDDGGMNSIFSIRATYSAAFCRFVTGLADSKIHGQRKTMFQRAVDLGLPASFVELRHEATHRELPSLIVLRNAAQRSLEWLWDYYWVKVDRDQDIIDYNHYDDSLSNPIKAIVRDILRQAQAEFDEESGELPLKSRKTKSRNYRLSSIAARLVTVCETYMCGSSDLSAVLVEESFLVPTGRGSGNSLNSSFSKWEQLLQMIIEKHPPFLTTLTEKMVNELIFTDAPSPSTSIQNNDAFHEAIYMWLNRIFKSETWKSTRRLLSPAYIFAACEMTPNSNNRAKSLRADLFRGDTEGALVTTSSTTAAGYDFQRVPTSVRDQTGARTTSNGAEPKIALGDDDDDVHYLADYGWQVSDRWDFRPLGVA